MLVRANFLHPFPLPACLLPEQRELLLGLLLPNLLLLDLLLLDGDIPGGEALIGCLATREEIQFLCLKFIVGRFARLQE